MNVIFPNLLIYEPGSRYLKSSAVVRHLREIYHFGRDVFHSDGARWRVMLFVQRRRQLARPAPSVRTYPRRVAVGAKLFH